MPNNLSKKIYELRKRNKLTLEQVADVVGVGKSTVRKWETGMIANMRRDKIALLAKALHTTPAYLMGWEEDNTPEEPKLTEGDAEWLSLFRAIPEELRDEAVQYVRSALKIAGLLQ